MEHVKGLLHAKHASLKSGDSMLNDLIIPKFDSVLDDILDHKYTHYAFVSGRGGTKSSFIAIAIVLLIVDNRNCHAICFRKVGNTLKDSVYANICWAISKLGLDGYFRVTRNPMEVTFYTGQKILFRGLDDAAKIRSIKAPPSKGDVEDYFAITHFEELSDYYGREEIRNVSQSTMRGGKRFWQFESFNPPRSRDHWENTDILEEYPDKLVVRNTYLDVPVDWLSEQFIVEAEKLKIRKPVSYEHEYLGIPTGTGGNVFDNLTERRIANDEIQKFDNIKQGVDFGFSVDPAAFGEMHFDNKRKILYIFNEIFEPRLTDERLSEKIKAKRVNNTVITADSSEPKSIAKLNSLGLRVVGAKKGPDSRDYGFKFLQDLEQIVIDKQRCPNAYREFYGYEYNVDRHGNFISAYPKKNDHYLDLCRYALESDMIEGRRLVTSSLRLF